MLLGPYPALRQIWISADGEFYPVQELVKVGCDVRYLNDSYRLNGLKASAAQQVGPLALLSCLGLALHPSPALMIRTGLFLVSVEHPACGLQTTALPPGRLICCSSLHLSAGKT